MKTYIDVLQAAQAYAAAILPEPEVLAPATPEQLVAWCEQQAEQIGQTLGDLSSDDLETAGGYAAWRALVVRCVAERTEVAP